MAISTQSDPISIPSGSFLSSLILSHPLSLSLSSLPFLSLHTDFSLFHSCLSLEIWALSCTYCDLASTTWQVLVDSWLKWGLDGGAKQRLRWSYRRRCRGCYPKPRCSRFWWCGSRCCRWLCGCGSFQVFAGGEFHCPLWQWWPGK